MQTQQATANPQHIKKTGVFALNIGAAHPVKCSDGKTRHFETRSRQHMLAKAEEEGRELTVVCRCLLCKEDFKDAADLAGKHALRGQTEKAMRAAGEAHVYAYLSEDLMDPKADESVKKLEASIAALRRSGETIVKSLGEMSDIKKVTAAEDDLTKINEQITKREEERRKISENMIGLMSDSEFE